MSSIQQRLRHVNPVSTRRYAKHTRYLAELSALPAAVRDYGAYIEEHLVAAFLGHRRTPSFADFARRGGSLCRP